MGACVSRPDSCVGGKLGGLKKKTRRRRKGVNRKVSFQLSDPPLDRLEKPLPLDRSFNNPTFKGSAEEAWFDSAAILESDCSDEDFQSAPDDAHSVSAYDALSQSSITSPRFSNHRDGDVNSHCSSSVDLLQRPEDSSHLESPRISANDDAHGESGLLDNCGILPNNCLPCLASTAPSVEKRRSLSSSPPSARKKAALKNPFKWKEGNSSANLLSSKALLQRPLAGAQVPFCPLEKKVSDSWSHIEPSSFKVRGANYPRDKKKDFASNCAAYYPFGVDVFLSPQKINHVARYVELPAINHSAKLPPILVVNAQIPLYPATFFQNETDGEGFSIVMYFKLNERYAKELSSQFQESILVSMVPCSLQLMIFKNVAI
ncbi:OLC1v1028109C3 [Oldenlandia corymbosa var. corymbosa]|uniref:OLC1v1028109C3 n=1 Tax=Oldenlandia corymbosa var. corymbosa TaxID=529605 RepID=A0AAV1CC58_OLDCO|nr:OLC1v1028109C3 [Oldenlandia corymbosa var. corymbosa]